MRRPKLFESTLGLLAFAVLIQAVPYGRAHTNPPIVQEPKWDTPRTRELAHRSCFDCHSNETVWPWYSHVAPMSWLVQFDVNGARSTLNLSDWRAGTGPSTDTIAKEIREGDMPPLQYWPMHKGTRLSDDDRKALADGLTASMRTETAPVKAP